MKAGVPIGTFALYRRSLEVMQATSSAFRVHPLRILIGLLLNRHQVPTLGGPSFATAGELSSLLYQTYSKESPFDLGVAGPAFLKLFDTVDTFQPGGNDWRNGFNSQKGIGCFGSVTDLQSTSFRHALRPDCPHRRLGPDGDVCDLSAAGSRCRSVQEHAGETPKLLQQTGSTNYRYQFLDPVGADLAKLRSGSQKVPLWPFVVSLYAGAPHLNKGRGTISSAELWNELGITPGDAADLFEDSPTEALNERMAHMTEPFLLASLRKRLHEVGFSVSFADLINFYLSLKPRGFVILTGISGTGKSRLPRLFAELIASPTHPDITYHSVAVRPGWNDVSDLLGFYNSLHGGYEPGPAVEAFRKAQVASDDDGAYASIMLLDELNLARVEHYFADFLSVMETREEIGSEWVTDPLVLSATPEPYLPYVGATTPTTDFVDRIPSRLTIPDNLFVVGSVNIDETTQGISNKVLDRANTIEFEDVVFSTDSPSAPSGWESADLHLLAHHLTNRPYRSFDASQKGAPEEVAETNSRLAGLYSILKKWRAHFGLRTRDEICSYMVYTVDFLAQASAVGIDTEGFTLESAFDRQILQKVLPRVSGTSEELQHGASGNLFSELEAQLESWDCASSVEKLRRMQVQEIVNFWEA